ncbi:MAG: hypothetical protein IKT59_08695 [Bacteroidales bacterium]|nr:hypothetical protein [Bacteroidales bacterium]
MKLNLCVLLAFLSALFSVRALAQQQEKMPDIYQQAEMEADRLQKLLDLEDWQTFYVDSTLKHDFPAMMAEYEEMKKAKIENTSMYVAVQDKWMEQIDATYRKIFTDEQWAVYLRQGAGKAQKAREKRRMKAEGKK